MNVAQSGCYGALNGLSSVFNSGYLNILSGTKPTNANATATGTLLAQFQFGTTAFGSPFTSGSNGSITANLVSNTASVLVSGTAGYARGANSSNGAVADFTVGTTGTDIILTTTS
jgi:hypothetical protein